MPGSPSMEALDRRAVGVELSADYIREHVARRCAAEGAQMTLASVTPPAGTPFSVTVTPNATGTGGTFTLP